MTRPAILMLLAVAGVLAFFVWKETEDTVAMLLAVLLLGAALVGVYDPAFPHGGGAIGRDVLLLLGGVACAYFALGFLDYALKPLNSAGRGPREALAAAVGRGLMLAWCLLPIAALAARVIVAPVERTAMWPIGLALVGSVTVLVAGGWLWISFLGPTIAGRGDAVNRFLMAPLVLAQAGVVLPLGAMALLAAAVGKGPIVPDWWAGAVTGGLIGLGLGAAIALAAPTLPIPVASRLGVLMATGLVVFMACCWALALWSTRGLNPAMALPGLLMLAVLIVALVPTFMFPLTLTGAREWASLAVLIVAPATVALGLAAMIAWPRIAAWLMGWAQAMRS